MRSWWGAIFDRSHREGHYNGSHYFIEKELFYGRGRYSMGYHQGVIIFISAVSIFFLEKGSFFLQNNDLRIVILWGGGGGGRGSLYFVTPAHNKTNKCPVRPV